MTIENLYKTGLCLLACSLLTSCGEFAYKRGASNKDFALAKQSCASSSEAEVAQCMKNNGWYVEKIDDIDLFASVSTQSNQAQSRSPTQAKETNLPANTVHNETKQASADADATEKSTPPTASTPATYIYKISSWWKLGGNGQKLEANLNMCSSNLGEKDLSNKAKHMYTRDFVLCMHQYGWKGLKEY